jgi:hypothetical protein
VSTVPHTEDVHGRAQEIFDLASKPFQKTSQARETALKAECTELGKPCVVDEIVQQRRQVKEALSVIEQISVAPHRQAGKAEYVL